MKKFDYPKQIITDFVDGVTSRDQFINQLSDWQKRNGINYDCKGYGVNGHNYLFYRNTRGEIVNGVIEFYDAAKRKHIAKSVFEFKRFVDRTKAGVRCTAR